VQQNIGCLLDFFHPILISKVKLTVVGDKKIPANAVRCGA
jgi:hypothetical protein